MSCEYCDEWRELPIKYAEGILGSLDAHIENDELFMMCCGSEAVVRINFCPKCGQDLREVLRDD